MVKEAVMGRRLRPTYTSALGFTYWRRARGANGRLDGQDERRKKT